MNTDTFYAATSALCFTLLGFWWVVVQYRHSELTTEKGPRRFAFLVSLHFILPGLASLASLLSGTGPLWRVTFIVFGLAGIAAAVVAVIDSSVTGSTMRAIARAALIGVPLYAGLILFAVSPALARENLQLEPLQVEGYLTVGVLLVGILLAWWLFTDPDLTPNQ
jgi:hypothetical protein